MSNSVAIIGASLAGVNAAGGLRRHGYDGRIVLIGDEPELPYDRPPLSKDFLLGAKSDADVRLHPDSFYVDNAIELRAGSRVTRLLPSEGGFELDGSGEVLRVDDVVLATGAAPIRLPVAGCELDGVFYLRTLADAIALRDNLATASSVVVVGGGFVGTEIAASAAALGKSVTIVEREPEILGRVLPRDLAALIAEVHSEKGVRILRGQTVTGIGGSTVVRHVELSDGSRIEADLVVIGIGVRPATELAAEIGIACDNGVIVDEYCRTSLKNVYAAGDVASFPDPILSRRIRLEHWKHAQNQGLAVAMSIVGEERPYEDVPWFWSHQFEHDIQLAGHIEGADSKVVRGDVDAARFCTLYLRDRAVVGAFGFNAGRDVRGAMELIRTAAPVTAAELADPSVDLRRLGRAGTASITR